MAKALVTDELWRRLAPLLPPPGPRRKRNPGRKPLSDRHILTGILFVLRTGIPWDQLPAEMGCGCGLTCLRRLRAWQASGAWSQVQEVLQADLPATARIDWERALHERAAAQRPDGHRRDGPDLGPSRRRLSPRPSLSALDRHPPT
jgi:transposase